MNTKNKILLGFYIILLTGIICGCGLINQGQNKNNKENMYNDNDKIVQEDNNYTYMTHRSARENNQIDIQYSEFSGIDTICFLEVEEDAEVTFDYDSTVDNGKFKVVLINPNNEVETISEGTEQSSKTIKLTKGKYSFKNVGANTDGKIRISIISNLNVKIIEDKKR